MAHEGTNTNGKSIKNPDRASTREHFVSQFELTNRSSGIAWLNRMTIKNAINNPRMAEPHILSASIIFSLKDSLFIEKNQLKFNLSEV